MEPNEFVVTMGDSYKASISAILSIHVVSTLDMVCWDWLNNHYGTFLYVFGLLNACPNLILVCFRGAGHECLVEAGTEVAVSQRVFAAQVKEFWTQNHFSHEL